MSENKRLTVDRLRMYKTAYWPLFEIFVNIDHVYENESLPLVYISGKYKDGKEFENMIATQDELTRYVF